MDTEESVTRCVCGQDDDNEGFMVCCEQCEVWQHGDCIGVKQTELPEMYYCEICAPRHPIHMRRAEVMARLKEQKKKHKDLEKAAKAAAKKRKVDSVDRDEPPKKPKPLPVTTTELPFEGIAPDKLTREQRKLQKLMEQFRQIEERQNRERTGADSTPKADKTRDTSSSSSSSAAARLLGDGSSDESDAGSGKSAHATALSSASKRERDGGAVEGKKKMSRDERAQNRQKLLKLNQSQDGLGDDDDPGASSKKKTGRGRRRMNRRNNKRKLTAEEESAMKLDILWLRRTRDLLSPMYLGKKNYIMHDYREARSQTHDDYVAREGDTQGLPLTMRLRGNYIVQQNKAEGGT
jgi:hypothetical protein